MLAAQRIMTAASAGFSQLMPFACSFRCKHERAVSHWTWGLVTLQGLGWAACLRGLLRMMSLSGGLKPSAVAGSPSVTRFTHSSCTGFSTSGRPALQASF